MMRNKIFKNFLPITILVLILFVGLFDTAFCKDNIEKSQIVSNKLFSISMPDETKGTYHAQKCKYGINIYDKDSEKAGFGGFAFGVEAYKNASEYSEIPAHKKLGELEDKKGTIYDVVLILPTDVQFDYKKESPQSYNVLHKLSNTIDKQITGVNGTKYTNGKGTKGQDLYKDILNKHSLAINEKWNSQKLENSSMSYMYNLIKNPKKIGYFYYDVNGDGIEELFIGEIATGNLKGIIYDIYTIVDRQPKHVISGGTRNRYYICDDYFVCNEYSSGANESGLLVYTLVENSTELFPQVGFKYDGYKNKNNPWFISYNFNNDEWDNVPQKKFNERKSTFERYLRFDYTPFEK